MARAIQQNARSGSAGTVSQPTQEWRQIGGYRTWYDHRVATVCNGTPDIRPTDRSRHGERHRVMVNIASDYGQADPIGPEPSEAAFAAHDE
jgi:hypothetical protein